MITSDDLAAVFSATRDLILAVKKAYPSAGDRMIKLTCESAVAMELSEINGEAARSPA